MPFTLIPTSITVQKTYTDIHPQNPLLNLNMLNLQQQSKELLIKLMLVFFAKMVLP